MTITNITRPIQAGTGASSGALSSAPTEAPPARVSLVRLRVSADDAQRRALTQRELQVLTLVAAGGTREGIAHELGMAPDTVASHITRIYRALGARNAAHAVALAHGYGLIAAPPEPTTPIVTRQERRVLAGLAYGLTSEQVALHLSVSVDTVKTHRRRLYRKLGVSSRASAVDMAIRSRLLAVVVDTGRSSRLMPRVVR